MKFKKSKKNNLSITIIAIIIVFFAGFTIWSNFNKPVSADWYNTLWQYRQKITIDKTKVGGGAENETNFPVLVSITEPKLIKGAQTSGNDIMFTDSDGITKLSHEIESYNSTTGQLIAWVKVPTLTYQTNNVLYMYYGSSTAPSQQNATDVWSNGFAAVYHLKETGTNPIVNDSTSNANNSTSQTWTPTTSGKVNGGGSFSSSDIDLGSSATLRPSSYITVSAWVNPNVDSGNQAVATERSGCNYSNLDWQLYSRVDTSAGGQNSPDFGFGTGSGYVNVHANSSIPTSSWSYLTGLYDGSNIIIYINGASNNSYPYTSGMVIQSANMHLGVDGSCNNYLLGKADEVRVSNVARTAGWISTEYNNQNSPSTFLTLSSTVEKSKGPVLYWKMDEGTGTVINDSSVNKTSANLNSPINLPTWQTEDQCLSGKCLYFEGSNASASATVTLPNIQTVSLWTKPASSSGTIPFVSFSSGTGTIAISSTNLAVTTSGITSPTVYVNGKSSTTLISNQWNHIEVTTGTSFTATNPVLGKVHTTFFKGYIDEFKIYDYQRTAAEVKVDYNVGATRVSPVQTSLSNGLVGYWKLDESSGNAIDSSGNGNNGTWNGTGANHYTSGKFGNGGGFNGSDDNVSIAHNNIFNIANSITISSWVKTTNGVNAYITAKNEDSWYFCIGPAGQTANKASFYLAGVSSAWLQGTTNLNDGIWHHVVGTWDGSVVRVYVDGVQENSKNDTGTIAQGGSPVMLGSRYTGGYYGNESLDEVRIYNRALSASEITQLYNYAPGPIAQYNFEEGSGTTVKDSGGAQNDGTWNGTGNHWTNGKFGKAGNFNGSSDYVQIDAPSTALNLTDNFTTSAWIKFNTNPIMCPANYCTVISKRNGVNDPVYEWGVNNGNRFWWGGNGSWNYTSTTSFLANTWYFVTTVKSGSNVSFYLNGSLFGTITGNTKASTNNTLYIGVDGPDGVNDQDFFNGQIDQVKIYNYARTQAQIIADMGTSMTQTRPQTTKNPVGYWKFDGATTDSGPGRNDATASNTSWNSNGKFGKALQFNGTSSVVTVANTISSQTISMWVNPTTTTQPLITLASGVSVSASSGTITATGFTSPTIYVNGNPSTTLRAGVWNHVVVVDTAQTTANAITIGKATTYFSGLIDEVKIYNYALTSDEVKQDYNRGATMQLGNFGVASQSASALYCVPGDTSTCNPPVAEWNFDEGQGSSVADTSGNGNTGTWNGTGKHWDVGKVGRGGKFNGSDDYVQKTSPSFATAAQGTITGWFKTPSATSISKAIIGLTSLATSGDFKNFSIVVGSTNTAYHDHFLGFTVKTAGLTVPLEAYVNNYVVDDNNWHYFALTVGPAGNNIYIDGVQRVLTYINGSSASTDFFSAITSADTFDIGATTYLGGLYPSYFNGSIDQVRIYNYARTAAQVAWDYNNGKPVAYWKMDECTGTTIKDLTGNGNTGTLTNATAGDCNTNANTAWYNGRSGKFGASLSFDGVDDYVTLGRQLLNGLNDFSVGFWLYKNQSPSNSYRLMTQCGDPNNNCLASDIFSIGVTNSGAVHAELSPDSSYCYTNNTTSTLSNNAWHHILVTRSGATVKIYLDSVLSLTYSSCSTGAMNATRNFLFTDKEANSVFLNGRLDDVQIFNYALTAAQVKNIYNQNSAVRFGQ